MPMKLKSRVRTTKVDVSASEIARLKIDLEQERVKGQRYRLAAESAANLIYEWDLGSRVEWLGHVDELLGYQPNEIPRTWEGYTSLLHNEDRERVLAAVDNRLKSEEPYCVESRVRRKDGTYLYWQDRGTVVRDESGKPVKWLGAVSDITERKRTEEALRKTTAQLENTLAAIDDLVTVQDRNLHVVLSNWHGREHITEEERRSEPYCYACYMRRNKPCELCPTLEVFRIGHAVTMEVKNLYTGKILEVSAYPVPGVLGNVEFVTEHVRDITERKQAEGALRRAEENFRRSLDSSPLGISIVSAEGEMLYVNQAMLDLYGYDDIDELQSTPISKRYTAASYAEYQARKKKRMAEGDVPSEYEIDIIRKTGEIRHLQVFRKEIIWDDQKRFQAIYHDMTDQNRAEAKLHATLLGLRKALGGIIQVLSAASEFRDPYTAGHQRRVADLARAIAQELALSPDQVEGIRVAGVVHDIGKLGIPAEILSKPTRLSKLEFSLIQSHAQIGHDILRDIEFSWPIAQIILQHHERLDGSGYPQGLKGDDILFESRILAVSDVIEAMASHRPYRPALGIEAALKEIEAGKGVLYDPAVVSACLKLFREKGYAMKK